MIKDCLLYTSALSHDKPAPLLIKRQGTSLRIALGRQCRQRRKAGNSDRTDAALRTSCNHCLLYTSLRHTVTYAVCIMAVGLLIFQLFPTQLLKMFSASDTMLSLGVPALRIISLSFILAGFGISCSSIRCV